MCCVCTRGICVCVGRVESCRRTCIVIYVFSCFHYIEFHSYTNMIPRFHKHTRLPTNTSTHTNKHIQQTHFVPHSFLNHSPLLSLHYQINAEKHMLRGIAGSLSLHKAGKGGEEGRVRERKVGDRRGRRRKSRGG